MRVVTVLPSRGLAVPCFADDPADLDYAAAGATWFIESPTSPRPGWLEAVRDRIRRGPEVQSGRG